MRRANLLLPVIVVLLLLAVVYLVSAQGNAPAGAQWEYMTINLQSAYVYDVSAGQFVNYQAADSQYTDEINAAYALTDADQWDTMLPAILLNLYGRDGWELVDMTPDPFYAVMRRTVAP